MTSGPLRRILGLARRAADPTDDAGLLARFAATGDADAFELLVWRHGGMVFGVARRILGDVHAAEDAFQATFLALARQAQSVRKNGCVAGWLHRVARRVALRARRRPASGGRQPPGSSLGNQGADAPRSPDDPLATAERRELSQVLDEELDRLPERFRRPVVLCYLEGRSTAEAAERLGCPRGTVLSRLATAREKLKARLLRRGIAPAILPAMDLPPLIHGGLTSTTVRAVIANSATPQVIDLCDGVIRAMILSKLNVTAAVVMTLGLIGGGAGWMEMTPGVPGVALAGPQAKAADKTDPAQEPQRRTQDQLDRTYAELDRAQLQMAEKEEQWATQRIDARLKLVEAEIRLKQIERALSPENRETRELQTAEDELRGGQRYLQTLITNSVKGENDPVVHQAKKRLQDSEDRVRKARAEVEKRQEELETRILPARREMMVAEERLSLLDRLTALNRRAAQSQVEDLQDRLGQLRGATGRPDPVERRVKDLEHKLDDVLRELTELRRELRK